MNQTRYQKLYTNLETEDEVGTVNLVKTHTVNNYRPLQGSVVLLWFSVSRFWYQGFSDISPYLCSYYFYFWLGC